MDSSGMKLVILRVGVALVLSATGLILAMLVSRKGDKEETSSARNPESSLSPSRNNDGEEEKESLVDHQKLEILSLSSRLEELQRKYSKMELCLKHYCSLKDQEVMLVLEKSQLEFLRREVSAMEEELKRGQELVILYFKLVGENQELRSENWFLEGEAKMLKIRVKQLHRLVNKKSRKSISVEKKLLKCLHKLKKKNNDVKELEGQVKGLKEELLRKSNSKSEVVSVEDHRRVLEESEDLKTEVIYLRWINACLRHEVKRNGTSYEGAFALPVVADEPHKWGKRCMKKLKRCVGGQSGKVHGA